MLIRSPRTRDNPPPLHIHFSSSEIDQVSSFKLLGVLINDTLTWTDHINHVATRMGRGMKLLRLLSWFLSQSLLVLYLKSCLWLTTVMWYGTSAPSMTCLQSLFNYACCLALHHPRHSSFSALWKELCLTSLHCRRRLHHAELMYKMSQFTGSSLSLISLPSSHSPPQHTEKNLINLPAVRMTFGQYAVAYHGASLWQSLPVSLYMILDP